MDEYKRMSDEELISTLRKYNISHGPIVGSTRVLYEKKLYECEHQKRTFQPSFASHELEYRNRDFENDDVSEEYYEEKITRTAGYPQTFQRKSEFSKERDYYKDNSYQNISQTRQSLGTSQRVEARKPIRENKRNEVSFRTRYIPLWLQLFLLILLIGALAYLYYVKHAEENPFKTLGN
ncbi:emerin [Pelobates fuscus]|uniref:emerin n=1 Tax=Pelobates fuscus TaxID=191477 RepID=UPI002FE4EFC9